MGSQFVISGLNFYKCRPNIACRNYLSQILFAKLTEFDLIPINEMATELDKVFVKKVTTDPKNSDFNCASLLIICNFTRKIANYLRKVKENPTGSPIIKQKFDIMKITTAILENLYFIKAKSAIFNRYAVAAFEELVHLAIVKKMVSADAVLNRILFEITSQIQNQDESEIHQVYNSLYRAFYLYPTLQKIILNCDKELSVELILVSLTHTMKIRPISVALQLSSILFYSLDENGSIKNLKDNLNLPHFGDAQNLCTNNYSYFDLKSNPKTKNFIENQVKNFKNKHITDELQRCRLESSFKRAIGNKVEEDQSSDYFVGEMIAKER